MTPAYIARIRTAYHAACAVHRGDPSLENTHAVRAAHAALESAKGGNNGR
jgi:hypothetical protein